MLHYLTKLCPSLSHSIILNQRLEIFWFDLLFFLRRFLTYPSYLLLLKYFLIHLKRFSVSLQNASYQSSLLHHTQPFSLGFSSLSLLRHFILPLQPHFFTLPSHTFAAQPKTTLLKSCHSPSRSPLYFSRYLAIENSIFLGIRGMSEMEYLREVYPGLCCMQKEA